MSTILKQTLGMVRLNTLKVALAVFICLFTYNIVDVYKQQSRFSHLISTQIENNSNITLLIEDSYSPESFIGLRREAQSSAWHHRVMFIDSSNINIVFSQPIIAVLLSPLFLIFSFFAMLFTFLLYRDVTRKTTLALVVIDTIEDWAATVVNSDKVTHVKELNSITKAINTLHAQLNQHLALDISSDENIRASVLLDQDTGIGNRAFFDNRLQAFLKEDDAQGAVLLIQFHEYDIVQSMYGDQQAKNLFQSLIQITKQRLNQQTHYFLARRGDFELAVLLPRMYSSEVEKLTSRLLKNLQGVELPIGVNHEEFIHIGISCFDRHNQSYDIMAEADMALRSAQLQGPSQWFMYDATDLKYAKAKGSLRWRTLLTSVLEKNAFVIFFQPVISNHDGELLHHEVLSKVRDSDGTLINAGVFLPMAAKCGLTKDIDLCILAQVCRVLSYENSEEDCSINISIESLLSESFRQAFDEMMRRFPEVARRLIIEVSEYQLVNYLTQLQSVLIDFERMGIRLIVDKVGQYVVSGHYMKSCCIYALKLHRSIVLDINLKNENQVFIQSLKTLAEPQHIHIYALGVESADEWRRLLALGIKGGQGHFFTEPVEQVAMASHVH